MSWTALKSASEWDEYRKAFVAANNLGHLPIAWGNGPQEYPCLVATMLATSPGVANPKLASAYVYRANAEGLLALCPKPDGPAGPDQIGLPRQQEFNRWVTALTMTLAYYCVESGLCREDAFEQKLAEMLETADLYHSERKTELQTLLSKTSRTILGCLDNGKPG